MQILESLSILKAQQQQVNPLLVDRLLTTAAGLNLKAAAKLEGTADRLTDCGSFLTLREWLDHGNEITLHRANFCKLHTLCRPCAIRRASKLSAAYSVKFEELLARRSSHKLVMVTLTVKNTASLAEGMAKLSKCFSKMVAAARMARHDPRRKRLQWLKVVGGVRSFEVTFNKAEGTWHPHVHCLVVIDDYIDQKALAAEWLSITKDSYVVDVRLVKGGLVLGLLEVFKYVTKFSSLTPEYIVDLYLALKGKRMVEPVGQMRGLEVDDSHIGEDLGGRFVEYYARWKSVFYRVVRDDGEVIFDPEAPDAP